ncbi:MAG: hypothetical protein GEV03_11610 [Streptosporangiales bacterium]|nr:hypothetical protein [Streptosporangiales bacterium]
MSHAMRHALLWWTMLRYRVAVMLWLFLLLGTARHGGLVHLDLADLLATCALGAAYVSATTVNDIADREIDAINHPDSRGRPLVTGRASERELYVVHGGSAVLALALAAGVGWTAVLIVLASLLVGHAYSLPPLRLSYRTFLAPVTLAVAYVLLPYLLGVTVAGGRPGEGDRLFVAALLLLFVGRIVVKDFRDRRGDAAHGKPTLLLRFGKGSTCLVSGAAVAAGNVLLLLALRPHPAVATLLELFLAGVYLMLWRLWRATSHDAEQLCIGVAAKMGNGLLITVLGLLALASADAAFRDQLLFGLSMAAVFGASFVVLLTRPDQAVIGYRG